MDQEQEPRRVSLPEAARRLGLHRATVNDMINNDRIPATRVGPHWYITERDLEAFAADYTRPRNSPRRPARQVEPSAEVLGRLADWGDATVKELAIVVDMHDGNIRKHLCIAEAQGLARRDEYSRWSLTEAGIRVAPQA